MYVVVDSSVLIAAFLRQGGFVDQLLAILEERDDWLVCTSQAIIEEVSSRLRQRGVSEADIQVFISSFLTFAVICDESVYGDEEIRDDRHILGCVRECRANLVVTNDKALIVDLKRHGIGAVRPSQFKSYFPKK